MCAGRAGRGGHSAAHVRRASSLCPRRRGDNTPSLGRRSLIQCRGARLGVIALVCLYATAILASAVAHGRSPYGFEDPAIKWLGPPFAIRGWAHLAELLAAPTIIAVLVVSFGVGLARRAFVRVVFYAALAAWALLISEDGVKPLVQRTYDSELTFPSGNVTAVSATALAMWLALGPLLGRRSRHVTLVLGGEWVLLMSLAVVGAHWHTPLDAIGSVLLSVGVVTAGAAVYEPAGVAGPCEAVGRNLFGEQGGK
jgi:membrane-associated phospholipid phosphatase